MPEVHKNVSEIFPGHATMNVRVSFRKVIRFAITIPFVVISFAVVCFLADMVMAIGFVMIKASMIPG